MLGRCQRIVDIGWRQELDSLWTFRCCWNKRLSIVNCFELFIPFEGVYDCALIFGFPESIMLRERLICILLSIPCDRSTVLYAQELKSIACAQPYFSKNGEALCKFMQFDT